MKSLRTHALFLTIRSDNPFLRAVAENVLSVLSSSCAIGNSEILGATTPESSLDMSSKSLNSSFMAATEASICSTIRLRSAAFTRPCNRATNKPRACNGCRKSWLAAAMKRDLAWFASPNSRVLACNASKSRTFSSAITAWSATVVANSISRSVNGRSVCRKMTKTPIGTLSRMRGMAIIVRFPPALSS